MNRMNDEFKSIFGTDIELLPSAVQSRLATPTTPDADIALGGKRQVKKARHGYAPAGKRSPTYRTWIAMVSRCSCPTNAAFHHYGGRGITVCQRWRDSFPDFLEDMGERPEGMSIGRIDNSKGYCKENCEWQTQKQQNRNTRSSRFLSCHGETKTLAEWAEQYGLVPETLRRRLATGWAIEEALNIRPQPGNAHVRRQKN